MEDKVKNENDSNTKRQEIAPGVFFEKRYEKISGKLFANIEIDNTVFRLVDIKVDLSKSSRIQTFVKALDKDPDSKGSGSLTLVLTGEERVNESLQAFKSVFRIRIRNKLIRIRNTVPNV